MFTEKTYKTLFIQYLIDKGIDFEYKKSEILYNLLALDNKNFIGNNIQFKDKNIKIFSYFTVNKFSEFELKRIINNINDLKLNFSLSIEANPLNEKYFMIIVKCEKFIDEEGELLNPTFWEEVILNNIAITSNIMSFLINIYQFSFYFLNSSFDEKDFQNFIKENLINYFERYNIQLKKQIKHKRKSYEEIVKNMTKEEISKELEKELSIFKNTKDDSKLKIISKYYTY